MPLARAPVTPPFVGIALAVALLLATSGVAHAQASQPFINELHYDNVGTDSGEQVELLGPAGLDLSGYTLLLYNGANQLVYDSIALSGVFGDEQNGWGALAFAHAPIQNGAPDGLALVDGSGNVLEFLSYEGAFVAIDGAAAGLMSHDIGVAEDGTTLEGDSLQRIGQGTAAGDFNWTGPTTASFGQINTSQTLGSGPATVQPIHAVQGSGEMSPLAGSTVIIEGIVVGVFRSPSGQSGYFVQEEDADADGDARTSEGLFVYDASTAVHVGDLIQVTGPVVEYQTVTEISGVVSAVIKQSGVALPSATPVSLPVADPGAWEALEGMRVQLSGPLTVTGHPDLGRYGEVVLSNGRLWAPTAVAAPGAAANAIQADNVRNRLVLDDGQSGAPATVPYLGGGGTLRLGDTLDGVSGVLDHQFGAYRIHPDAALTFTRHHPRPSEPEVSGRIRVASFNVLNYFNGDGTGGGFPTSRGATNATELARQEQKLVAAMTALSADVLAVIEIENDGYGPNSAIRSLVDALNSAVGSTRYAFVDPGLGQIGRDEIAVGFLYDQTTLSTAGAAAILDSQVDGNFLDTKNRPVLAQTFVELASGERFTLAVAHLKSKGADCDDVGDPDRADGQGNCNATRTAAASAIDTWLSTDPTGSGDPDHLLVGDLNAYTLEDPITALTDAGWVDLLPDTGSDYSFVFDGQAGALDHALANPTLAAQVMAAGVFHINADEPQALDYDERNPASLYQANPYRSSDHDPLVVGLALARPDPGGGCEATNACDAGPGPDLQDAGTQDAGGSSHGLDAGVADAGAPPDAGPSTNQRDASQPMRDAGATSDAGRDRLPDRNDPLFERQDSGEQMDIDSVIDEDGDNDGRSADRGCGCHMAERRESPHLQWMLPALLALVHFRHRRRRRR